MSITRITLDTHNLVIVERTVIESALTEAGSIAAQIEARP